MNVYFFTTACLLDVEFGESWHRLAHAGDITSARIPTTLTLYLFYTGLDCMHNSAYLELYAVYLDTRSEHPCAHRIKADEALRRHAHVHTPPPAREQWPQTGHGQWEGIYICSKQRLAFAVSVVAVLASISCFVGIIRASHSVMISIATNVYDICCCFSGFSLFLILYIVGYFFWI